MGVGSSVSTAGAINKLIYTGDALRFIPLLDHSGGTLQIIDDTLWYAINKTIHACPLSLLREGKRI